MRKILLIIAREYWVRVRKKSFIVLTFLIPMLIAGLYGMMIYLMINQDKMGSIKKVQIIDSSQVFIKDISTNGHIQYIKNLNSDFKTAKKELKKNGIDYILYIPSIKDTAIASMGGQSLSPLGIQLIGEKEPSIQEIETIHNQLNDIIKNKAYLKAGIDTAQLNKLKPDVKIESTILTSEGERKGNSMASFGIALTMAVIIYLFILIYGIQVMRGVMEEKTSRVVEVIISSVSPFQLMMGKIIGLALVGLTQFLLWIILTSVVSPIIGIALGNKISINSGHQIQNLKQSPNTMTVIMDALSTQNYPVLIGCFLFYFLTGYLLYAALFAAAGAAVDSETETQQFVGPITIPLVFAIIFSSNYVILNPDTALSFWLSIIPIFSPIVMMVRMPFHPPLWQVFLSMFLMIPGFIGTVWFAAKIYRTGILMYGKKVTFKELGKWLFYKS